MAALDTAEKRNPLARFRTYSYHHIMAVCDSTDTAYKLGAIADQGDFAFFSSDAQITGEPQTLTGGSGQFYILIDGTRHARYYIDELRWKSIFHPCCDERGKTGSNSTETMGEITILEPMGFLFINEIVKISNAFKRDFESLVIMIKTVFVGNPDDPGGPILDREANIFPFICTMTGLQALIDHKGATYKAQLVAIENGLSKLPKYQVQGQGVPIKLAGTVDQAMKHYIDQVNTAYNAHVKSVLKQVGATFEKSLEDAMLNAKDAIEVTQIEQQAQQQRKILDKECIRTVTYKLGINDYADSKYRAGSNTNIQQQTVPGEIVLQIGTASVHEAITRIVLTSKEIQEEAILLEGKKYKPQIYQNVEIDTQGNQTITINIRRYEIETYVYDSKGQEALKQQQQIIDENDVYVYDYIFSGKNVDILTLDMSFKNAFAFMQTMLIQPSLQASGPGVSLTDQGAITMGGAGSVVTGFTPGEQSLRCNNTLYFGGQVRSPTTRTKTNPSLATSYSAAMDTFAAVDNLMIKMTIAGSSKLLGEQLNPDPNKISVTRPYYFKINFWYPNDWLPPDGSVTPGSGTSDRYASLFWYKGLYRLFTMEHIFRQGKFTQDIELIALSVPFEQQALSTGDLMKMHPGQSITGPTKSQVASTYASRAPQATLPGSNKPLGSAEREANRKEAYDFFISKGYTPEQAAGIVGNIQQESSFNPNCYNKRESAVGYGQWQRDRLSGPNGLEQFAAKRGTSVYDKNTQLEFMHWEMQNTEKKAGAALKQAQTPEAAAYVVDRRYERSAGTETTVRQQYARDAYTRYGPGNTSGAT